jgi:hypothetical protein
MSAPEAEPPIDLHPPIPGAPGPRVPFADQITGQCFGRLSSVEEALLKGLAPNGSPPIVYDEE